MLFSKFKGVGGNKATMRKLLIKQASCLLSQKVQFLLHLTTVTTREQGRTGTALKSQTLCPLSRPDSHRCVALCMLSGTSFPEELAVVSRDFHFYQEALSLIRFQIVWEQRMGFIFTPSTEFPWCLTLTRVSIIILWNWIVDFLFRGNWEIKTTGWVYIFIQLFNHLLDNILRPIMCQHHISLWGYIGKQI